MPVTIGSTLSFCGQDLAADDLAFIRQIIADYPNLSQTELASTLCELLDWRRPNGGLKSRGCFLFLQQLQQRGWVESLPELRTTKQPGNYPTKIEPSSDPQRLIDGALANYLPLELRRVQTPRSRAICSDSTSTVIITSASKFLTALPCATSSTAGIHPTTRWPVCYSRAPAGAWRRAINGSAGAT